MNPIALGFKPRIKPTLQFWGRVWQGGETLGREKDGIGGH